jgi:hypothetical protein
MCVDSANCGGYCPECVAESMKELRSLRAENARQRSEYMELIYAVATKHPNETRHQTALRYIMQRESQQAHGPDKALRGEGE